MRTMLFLRSPGLGIWNEGCYEISWCNCWPSPERLRNEAYQTGQGFLLPPFDRDEVTLDYYHLP